MKESTEFANGHNPEPFFEWPRSASNQKDWLEASRRWFVLRRAYPDNPEIIFAEINSNIEAEQYETAESLLNAAAVKYPEHRNVLLGLVATATRTGRLEEAGKVLSKACEMYPDFFMTWIRAAEFEERRSDFMAASAHYLKAKRLAPDRVGPALQHAELAMRAEKWDEALNRWSEFRAECPDHPAGYHRAAFAARQLGNTKLARQLILQFEYGTEIVDSPVSREETPTRKRDNRLKRLQEQVWVKALFNLKSEVDRNYLGYGWWVIEPLLHMTVYYFVFGVLLQHGGDNYPLFLLLGLVPWMWIMKTVNNSANSILSGQNLMLQVNLPPIFFPLVVCLQTTIKQVPVFLLLLTFVLLQGYTVTITWFALLPLMVVQAILIVAISLAAAGIIPFFRDFSHLVPTALTFLMFISGVFFDYHNIPAEYHELFLLNPVAFLLSSIRGVIMFDMPPDYLHLFWLGVITAASCWICAYLYKRLGFVLPRTIIE